jgi:hypothetical protein
VYSPGQIGSDVAGFRGEMGNKDLRETLEVALIENNSITCSSTAVC